MTKFPDCKEFFEKKTVADLKKMAKQKGIKGYSTMNKNDLCKVLSKFEQKKKKMEHLNPCLKDKDSASECFLRLIEEYPSLCKECPSSSARVKGQNYADVNLLLKKDDKIVGVVDDMGKIKQVAPPAPPPPPSYKIIPVKNVNKGLLDSIKKSPKLSKTKREKVIKVNKVSDLMDAIRKGKKLKKIKTPTNKKAVKDTGMFGELKHIINLRYKMNPDLKRQELEELDDDWN